MSLTTAIESLEPRLTLSAVGPDLAVSLDTGTTGRPALLVTNAGIDWSLVITNVGTATASGSVRAVAVVAYADARQAYLRSLATIPHLVLAPAASRNVPLRDVLGKALPIDNFALRFQITSRLTIPDSNPDNDQSSGFDVRTAQEFGRVGARQVIASFFFPPRGGTATASLTGGGAATLAAVDGATAGFMALSVTGSTDRTRLSTAAGLTLTTVDIDGPMNTFAAARARSGPAAVPHGLPTTIPSHFHAAGAVGNIVMTSCSGDIRIGPASGSIRSTALNMKAGFGGDITSDVPLSVIVNEPNSYSLDGPGTVTAPSIDRLFAPRDRLDQIDLTLTDPDARWSIHDARVADLTDVHVRAASSIGSFRVGSMTNSALLVGVPDSVRGSTVAPSQLAPGKTLDSLVIGGGRGGSIFWNSNVVAPQIGSVDVAEVSSDPFQTPGGIAAVQIASYRRRRPAPGLHLTNLSGTRVWDSVGDYAVQTSA